MYESEITTDSMMDGKITGKETFNASHLYSVLSMVTAYKGKVVEWFDQQDGRWEEVRTVVRRFYEGAG